MMKLAEKYGPVTAFYLGPSQAVVSVCGFDAVREALRNPDVVRKPNSFPWTARTCLERFSKKIMKCSVGDLISI